MARRTVRFYGESQCPFCRNFVTDVWQPIWEDPEFRSSVDYDFIPWGNAYFASEACGKGPYSSTERHCWAQKCQDSTSDNEEECYGGKAIYQHSEKEGQVDIYESCVKALLGIEVAVTFTYCCEGKNMDDTSMTAQELMELCLADSSKEDVSNVQSCYENQGHDHEVTNAKKTPPHPGVPYVVVDGVALDNPMETARAICDALHTK